MFLSDVDQVKLTDDQYSYQHVKAFGIHNHLVHDPWNQDTVYFVDSTWSVYSFTVNLVSIVFVEPGTVGVQVTEK